MNRKNFIHINESFTCEHCNHHNKPSNGKIRNHCQKCLYSKHLDKDIPGDRASNCKALMPAINAYQNSQKGWVIMHQCTKCNKEIPNIVLEDDNWDEVIKLTTPK